jgi:uracil-DNA glycosylase family 4
MSVDPGFKHRLLMSLRAEVAGGLKSTKGRLVDAPAETRMSKPVVAATLPPRRVAAPVAAFPEVVAPVVARTSAVVQPSLPAPLITVLPILSTAAKTEFLETMNRDEVRGCTKCRLHETRTQTVFGEGDVDAKIFFIGEGPGETEDQTGRPFVGKAGQLLDKMIVAMGLSRSQVFIANIVKCRPPMNRVPGLDEVETCTPYLVRQLETIRPEVIVTLGLPAIKYMTGDFKLTMGRMRGTFIDWRGIKLMPTYHPAYLLRSYTEANRAAVWSDLQQVMAAVGLKKN